MKFIEIIMNKNEIYIKSVYNVKDIGKNILSFSRITKNNYTIVAKNNNAKIFHQNKKKSLLTALAECFLKEN